MCHHSAETARGRALNRAAVVLSSVMLARLDDGKLRVRSVDGQRSHVVDLGLYRSISSIALDYATARVAFTAVSGSGREPDVGSNKPGDLRLFVADLESGHVRPLSKGYAHDAAWFPDGTRIAFHNSRGVTVIDAETGRECDTFATGRFSWGPPSVSVSPGGGFVAAIKWKGDDRKILVCDLTTREVRVHRPSCYEYAWWSEDRIVYTGGSSISVLNRSTGAASRWLTKARAAEVSAQLRTHAGLGATHPLEHVSGAVAYMGRVYFRRYVLDGDRHCSAVVSLNDAGNDFRVHALAEGPRRLCAFTLLNRGQTISVDYTDANRFNTVIGRGTLFVGEHADTIPPGYAPMPLFATPQFGFHALPGDSAPEQPGASE